ncbi:SCO2523 family variant P-loop protein [Streptomyces sp. NPDC002742]|uniref:SCO2523 family variant P-loop protein n=1 Tax=Streptomyces sp. NPDC002742 TaxID=3364663 RepID=UPI0036B6CF1C
MLVFAASDKGGTGRSVTSANLAYRRALAGDEVCYLDFDFGSPTAAAVFGIPRALDGFGHQGLHSYLWGTTDEPARIDVWASTERRTLRDRPSGSGRLVLLPADRDGGEFVTDDESLHRCVDLFLRLNAEFDVIVVDLSAGRSYAMDMVLRATSRPELRGVQARWLVYHRWTPQHVTAAADLVSGIVKAGADMGHEQEALSGAIRFVRAAVPAVGSPLLSQVPSTTARWMRAYDEKLDVMAANRGIGKTRVLGSVPLEPVLLICEQLITDEDVNGSRIANKATWQALVELSERLTDDAYWGQP